MTPPAPARRVAPAPRPAALDDFVGKWIAVSDGQVVAAAETSRQLALQVHSMDRQLREKVVVEFVRPASDSYIVGVG